MERRLRARQYLRQCGIALIVLLTALVAGWPAADGGRIPSGERPGEKLSSQGKLRDKALQGPVRVIVELDVAAGGPPASRGEG